MLRRSWRVGLMLLVLLGCGDKTEVKVAEVAPTTSDAQDSGQPVTGDWLVIHSLSDPEQLNPLTSSDATASEILGFIFQSLLSRDPRNLELKPLIAESRPVISADKRVYTFKLRRDVRFQDGKPLTGEDALFSIKVIKCPLVNAPFLQVYFNSVIDARLVDEYTIQFTTKEPYFLNESVLGETVVLLPRHYYDPESLLKDVTVRDLIGDPAKLPEKVRKFADNFNKNYSRKP